MTNGPMSLVEALDELQDPRARECAYQLDELLLAAICAVISGAESWTNVVEWSETKLDWLRQQLPFTNGIASHDTFGRVFSLLDAKQFEACFVRWMNSMSPSLAGQHIAIDGKCVRGSHDGKRSAIHLVSAWSSANGADYVLGVKENQPGLSEAVKLWFDAADSGKMDRPFWTDGQTEKDHGRIETRRCLVTNDVAWLGEKNQHWVGLQSLIMIESTRKII